MKIKSIIILFIIAIYLVSCEDVVDIKLSDEDLDFYAVEARVTTDDNPFVYLYKSQKVDESDPYSGISGATVVISENSMHQRSITLKEITKYPGLYIPEDGTSFFGRRRKEYHLKISIGDVEINAFDTLAPVEHIDSIQVRASLRGDKRFLGIFTYGYETPGLGNYYKWDIYINNKLLYKILLSPVTNLLMENIFPALKFLLIIMIPTSPKTEK